MPIVGRKAETNNTATITANVARGTLRPGFLTSSDMLEIVSMPVYVTIAIEMLARKLLQVGATPRWMLWITTSILSRKKRPRMTRANCVIRSVMASTRLSALDSWMPMTLTTSRRPISTMVAPMCHGSEDRNSPNNQKYLPNTPRQLIAKYAEIQPAAAYLSTWPQPTTNPIRASNA